MDILFSAVLGGLWRRWWGGGIEKKRISRAIKAAIGVVLALGICYANSLDPRWLALPISGWLILSLSFREAGLDMGRMYGSWIEDASRMIVRNAATTIPIAAMIVASGNIWGAAYVWLCIAVPFGYEVSWRLSEAGWASMQKSRLFRNEQFSVGELIRGALLFGGLAAVL